MNRPQRLFPLVALASLALPVTGQYRISGPGEGLPTGQVHRAAISPDGVWAVYLANQSSYFDLELYSVRIGKAGETRLHPKAGGREIGLFAITPDSTRVVFSADLDERDTDDIYVVPVDGSSAPLNLTNLFVPFGFKVDDLRIDPTGTRAVFLYDGEVFSVALDGQSSPVTLSGPPVVFRWIESIDVSPDGNWVLYNGDQDTNGVTELYASPVDGSSGPVKLNDPLLFGGVETFAFAHGGSTVVYLAFQDGVGRQELYSVPVDASSGSVRLNGVMPTGADVSSLRVSPDGSLVAYRADQDVRHTHELYVVPADDSVAPLKLSGTMVTGGSLIDGGFDFSSDGDWVVYRADQDTNNQVELYSVEADGSSGPHKLNGALLPARDVDDHLISPDGQRVVFRADVSTPLIAELFTVPIDGQSSATRLHGPLSTGEVDAGYRIDASSKRVTWGRDGDGDTVDELYSAPLDASTAEVLLSDGLGNSTFVDTLFEVSPNGKRVLFTAFPQGEFRHELFSVRARGGRPAVRLSGPMTPGLDGDVVTTLPTRDGGVAYLARLDPFGAEEVDLTRMDGNATPRVLVTPDKDETFGALSTSPDRNWLVYELEDDDGPYGVWSAPSDGSGTGVRLTPPFNEGTVRGLLVSVTVTPDSEHVVYVAGQHFRFREDLYRVPVDGSSGSVRLNDPLQGRVGDITLSPDGSYIAYVSGPDDTDELYSVTLAGGTPVLLTPSFVAFGITYEFDFSSNGDRLVYRATQDTVGQAELYSVPADGSALPVKLNENLIADGDVLSFVITPNDEVVYCADPDTDGSFGLYTVPIDGSATPVRIAVLSSGPSEPVSTPDGTRVVYLNNARVYSVPVDDSQAPVLLNAGLGGNLGVFDFQLSPDGESVVFRADLDGGNGTDAELYSVPVDGSASQLRLGPTGNGTGVLSFELHPTRPRVVLHASRANGSHEALFQTRIDGRLGWEQINLRPYGVGTVSDFLVTPDGEYVLYHSDEEAPSHFALFAARLVGAQGEYGPSVR